MNTATITTVDVDADLASAAASGTARPPRRGYNDTPAPLSLFDRLGLPMQDVHVDEHSGIRTPIRDPLPASGLYRRLAATLRSVAERRDGNTWWAAGPPAPGEQGWPPHPAAGGDFRQPVRGSWRLCWWSDGGCSSARRWHLTAQVEVRADSWLATYCEVADVTLTVVSDSRKSVYPAPERDGQVTVYQAAGALSEVLSRPVAGLVGRDTLRTLAGARSVRQPWAAAPDAEWWLSHPA